MSIFVGRDNGSKPIFHITHGEATSSEMKSGILPSTVFHSSLLYITHTPYSCAITARHSNYRISTGLSYSPVVICEIPSEAIISLVSARVAFVVVVSANGVKKIANDIISGLDAGLFAFGAESSCRGWEHGVFFYQNTPFPTSEKKYMMISESAGTITEITLFVLNLNTNGYIGRYFSTPEVKIKKDDISVNGLNLLDYRYISTVKVNDIDTSAGQIQFINSITTGTPSLQLLSSPSSKKILSRGKVIFDSTKDSGKVFFKEVVSTYYPANQINISRGNGNAYRQLATGFDTGDCFYAIRQFPAPLNTPISSTLLIYAEGKIAKLYHNRNHDSKYRTETAWWYYGSGGVLYMLVEYYTYYGFKSTAVTEHIIKLQ